VTVDAANSVVGYNNVSGNNGALISATKAAGAAKLASIYNAEVAKQAAVALARDTLRATGDLAAF
jgi:hypothetical protein